MPFYSNRPAAEYTSFLLQDFHSVACERSHQFIGRSVAVQDHQMYPDKKDTKHI